MYYFKGLRTLYIIVMQRLSDVLWQTIWIKKNTGCQNAIYTLKKTVDYFTSRNATVNLCVVDLTKAFDRVSHEILFEKLIAKGVPLFIILVLVNWYDKLFSVVKWGEAFSEKFQIITGVRQGGCYPLFCLTSWLTKF